MLAGMSISSIQYDGWIIMIFSFHSETHYTVNISGILSQVPTISRCWRQIKYNFDFGVRKPEMDHYYLLSLTFECSRNNFQLPKDSLSLK